MEGSKFSKLVCGVARPIFHMIGANEQCSFNSKGVEDARGSEESRRSTLVVHGDK